LSLSSTGNNYDDDDYGDDYYEDPEPHEMEDLQRRRCSKIETITRSSVTGRTTIEKWESD
jgi:hypothetical protein